VEPKRSTTLRFLAEPGHVNFGGKVHGGQVMKWIDQVGYAAAAAYTGNYCVTVWVGGIHFMKPLRVGWIIEMIATVIHTGRTSLHIAVDIYGGDPRSPAMERSGHCVIVFVALDDDGKPTPVPPWVPTNEFDDALSKYAIRLMDLRKGMEEEMAKTLHLGPDPAALPPR
jgi:uncharacterized protein (TIGR00369 family)